MWPTAQQQATTPAIWIDLDQQQQVLGQSERPCSLSSSISMDDLSSLPSGVNASPSASPTNSSTAPLSPGGPAYIGHHNPTAADPISQFQKCRSISDAATVFRPTNRKSKAHRVELPEVTLVDEIEMKYNTEQGLGCSDPQGPSFFMKPMSSPNKACGFLPGKRGHTGYLELLALNHMQIAAVGDLGRLRSMVCNTTELDLANNCLSMWAEVSVILSHMPLLRHCNLSSNPLTGSAPLDWNLSSGQLEMMHLDSLVLNDTGVRWDVLCMLLRMLPNLQHLHLSKHNYGCKSALPSPHLYNEGFGSVRQLHLNQCNVRSWQSLCRLCAPFPKLNYLIAADNPLTELGYEDTQHGGNFSSARVLSGLANLNVNRSAVGCWSQVDRLNALPELRELRINGAPLLQPYSELEQWHLLVARLPAVRVLNGSDVSEDQRVDAERYFLRTYMNEQYKPDRYYELERVHGEMMPLAAVSLRPQNTLVQVEVVYEEGDYRRQHAIDIEQNVGQLRKYVAAVTHLPAPRVRMFHESHDDWCGLTELKYPSLMLHTIKLADGHRIHVQKKPEARKLATTTVRTRKSSQSTSLDGKL